MATPDDIDIRSGPERPEIMSSEPETDEISLLGKANTKNQRRGCRECTAKRIPNFSLLTGGEHLEMRGSNYKCCGRTSYNHHAIVDEVRQHTITNNGSEATVSLLHIPDTNGQIVKSDRKLDVVVHKVRLVEYTMRTHDLEATKERARNVADKVKVDYRVFVRNCEHFCSTATTSDHNIDTNLIHAGSQQARNCWRGLINCLCFGNRLISSTFTFVLYLAFLTSDDIIDIVPKPLAKNFADYCGSNNTSDGTSPWIHQKCHLSILGISAGFYAIYVLFQTCWLVSDRLSCKMCKLQSVFSLWFRFCLYMLIEVSLIFTEHYIFNKIRNSIMNAKRKKSLSRFIFALVVILKSFIECIIIFWLDNFFITFLPPYWVEKTKLTSANLQIQIRRGDVISFKQNKYAMSFDAIVNKVNTIQDLSQVSLHVIYQRRCKFWIFCCSYPVIEETVTVSREFVRVYDFANYSHLYSPDEVINNARNSRESWLCCCFRSSNFCYRAKVKDITCRERFNTCEWGCKRAFCC